MEQDRRRTTRRRSLLTGAISVALHGLMLGALLGSQPEAENFAEPEPILVTLVAPKPAHPPQPPEPKEAPTASAPVKRKTPVPPPPRKVAVRPARTPPPPDTPTLTAGKSSVSDGVSKVSDAELAGAATAGSGSGAGAGGGCNMVRWLEGRLRKDRKVRALVDAADDGHAIRVWNGQWVRHGEQEGQGMAAVREAIMWEVAFAPQSCRDEAVRGLVLISLDDAPGGARIVMGSGAWRWADLLGRKSGPRATPPGG